MSKTNDRSGEPLSTSQHLASVLSSCLCSDPQHDEHFRANVESTPDWERLLACARFHGLTSLLAAAILSSCSEAVPDKTLQKLNESRRDAIVHDLFLRSELVRLLQLFKQAGIRVLPLKGPILAQFLYSDSSLRPSSDLDLLVHPQDVDRAVLMLNSNGFKMEPFLSRVPLPKLLRLKSEILFYGQRCLMLDLHWEIAPSDYPFHIDPAILWDSVRAVGFEEAETLTLAPEALLVFLCVHGTKHAWSRLIWLADIARLTQTDLNWEEAFALATRIGCERPVLLGLLLAGEMFDAAVPSVYVDHARTKRMVVSRAEQVKQRLASDFLAEPTSLELTFFNTSMADRCWRKVRHLAALLKAPTEAELEWLSLPPGMFVLYYPLRIYRIILKYAAPLFKRA